MLELIAPLGIVVAAVVTGLVAWKTAKRGKSGEIDTSEAATLWDEGTIMRKELRDEVAALKIQLTEAVNAISTLNQQVVHSRQETAAAREETAAAREETRILMAQISALSTTTQEVLSEVKTSNHQTIAELADSDESRRILSVHVDARTGAEKKHLEKIPVEDEGVGPGGD